MRSPYLRTKQPRQKQETHMAYGAWIKDGKAWFRFDELSKIVGPFKFYIDTGEIVQPGTVYQASWRIATCSDSKP